MGLINTIHELTKDYFVLLVDERCVIDGSTYPHSPNNNPNCEDRTYVMCHDMEIHSIIEALEDYDENDRLLIVGEKYVIDEIIKTCTNLEKPFYIIETYEEW